MAKKYNFVAYFRLDDKGISTKPAFVTVPCLGNSRIVRDTISEVLKVTNFRVRNMVSITLAKGEEVPNLMDFNWPHLVDDKRWVKRVLEVIV